MGSEGLHSWTLRTCSNKSRLGFEEAQSAIVFIRPLLSFVRLQVMSMLHRLYKRLDAITTHYDLFKVRSSPRRHWWLAKSSACFTLQHFGRS